MSHQLYKPIYTLKPVDWNAIGMTYNNAPMITAGRTVAGFIRENFDGKGTRLRLNIAGSIGGSAYAAGGNGPLTGIWGNSTSSNNTFTLTFTPAADIVVVLSPTPTTDDGYITATFVGPAPTVFRNSVTSGGGTNVLRMNNAPPFLNAWAWAPNTESVSFFTQKAASAIPSVVPTFAIHLLPAGWTMPQGPALNPVF